jgi:hypothetical protein
LALSYAHTVCTGRVDNVYTGRLGRDGINAGYVSGVCVDAGGSGADMGGKGAIGVCVVGVGGVGMVGMGYSWPGHVYGQREHRRGEQDRRGRPLLPIRR